MAESPISLDYADIQGIILNGYGHQRHLLLLFLHVDDTARAKGWLKATLPHVRSAQRRAKNEPKPKTSANIALSWPGLQAFGVQTEAQLTFPREYWQGMDHGERTRVLGDTGDCDPKYWEFGGTTTPELHLLLMFYADSESALGEVTEQLWTSVVASSGLSEVYRQYSHKPNVNEPFGFRDGISQPAIEGMEGVVLPGQDILKTGEFILGYENEYGQKPPMPTVAAAQDPADLLPVDEIQRDRKAFGNNGSYMVVRKLEQDVTGFWDYMDRKTRRPDGTSDEYAKVFLAAKIVGRWPSGAPLTLAPDKDDPELGADLQRNNVFTFLAKDAEGFRCPIGAHMRRANPRDTMPPDPHKSLQVASHHRILRRGRPYKEIKEGKEKEGLVFIVMNADLQRQFEFIQQSWVNSPKFNGLYDNRDPLVSNFDPNNSNAEGDTDNSTADAAPQGTIMSIQANPVRRRLTDVPRFVQIKGGGYFFVPGIKTLRYLANTENPTPKTENRKPNTQPHETEHDMSTLNSLWASIVQEGHKLHDDFDNLRELMDLKLENLLARPGAIRPLFGFLRQHKPIFVAPHIAVVSLYDDVLEVLANDTAFSVTEIYLKKMEATTGDFVLGMPDTPQYQREIGLMHAAFHAEDLDTIRQFVDSDSARCVATAAPQGQIDAVEQLSRLVPTHLVGAYFGAPGPDDAVTMRWMRSIFREIFLDLGNDPNMGTAAQEDAKELNAYLNGVIAHRRAQVAAGEELPDDFLCRLVQMDPPVDDDTIRRIIGGTIVGAVDTNSKAIVQALDQLLQRPLQLAEAQAAARADDDAKVAQYVFEALRFNPQNPFLLRHCTQATTIAAGTPRATLIQPGTLVLVGTESAMFDAAMFPEPDTFWPNRPMESYIHFGHGLHTCFGKHIGWIVIPAVAKALLKQQNLRRADGDAGQLQYDGAFPNHFLVEFSSVEFDQV